MARGIAKRGTLTTYLWLLILVLGGCQQGADKIEPFSNATELSGIDFHYFNGASGQLYFAEMMGGGAALLDYDSDGDLDIYLVQGGLLGSDVHDALLPPRHPLPLTDRLYRNDSDNHVVRFTDVTVAAGLEPGAYGQGVAVGDINNDGFPDLYVTAFGDNRMLLNKAGEGFVDITTASGTASELWSVSAAFADFNRDGRLDLYVGNYVDYRLANHKPCRSTTSARDYCSPSVYRPQPDLLFINKGNNEDGIPEFGNMSAAVGISRTPGATLGVVTEDFNNDGWTDIYVANDGMPNNLWINQSGRGFLDQAPMAAVAVNLTGSAEASMGVDVADFDNDGDPDLFMTHLANETNTLYRNDGKGNFIDATSVQGLSGESLRMTGFGTSFIDFDGDGLLDLFVANGAVTRIQSQFDAGDSFPLRQNNQLFRNSGSGFVTVESAGGLTNMPMVSRGVASGDLDNDGDTDLIVVNNGGPAEIFLNELNGRNWIGITPRFGADQRVAIGAKITLETGQSIIHRTIKRDGSYASSSDPRVIFYTDGTQGSEIRVQIIWPNGDAEQFKNLEAGRYHTLFKGSGSD